MTRTDAPPRTRLRRRAAAAILPVLSPLAKALGYRLLRIRDRGGLGIEDGAIPYGTSVFDDDVPGVANLDPALLDALRRAAADAAADRVAFTVNSGWRTPDYQRRLRREAVARYGSEEAAARWVSTPETSPHVNGAAVDLGPAAAQAWLDARGAAYGLCRIYGNEPWHYELRPEAAVTGPPPLHPTPADDPRHRPLGT
ncbi:D-alanyl-D-alanine carboxypeptidase [Glycomyces sambucus]|uniref:D-alanyl-D-alanine carboxypeptidase n=1 Tax=Glycomyces sambucus TaxID=380244 RepID=A0A1G9LWJ6_9ACTN|nr:M15 family metallopeptidase [Glycomyces sambucus]SDL66326.1 D-alanyl-D-alanine carboxypeptidase [Glycomyces sambucus]